MVPRAHWKGFLKLSLVSCPVALYPAVAANERISFRQVNKQTGNRLRQQLVDVVTGEPVQAHNKARGYDVGENIAWGTLWLSSPRAIVAAWMASPPHRANILNARFRDTAIGVSPHPPSSLARGQSGGVYTQDFGVIITG